MDLCNTHAVVTGGASGIGAEISRQLLAANATVTIMGRRQAALDAFLDTTGSDRLHAQSCDVSDPVSVQQAFELVSSRSGAVAILVNCAGAAPTKPFHKLTADDWNSVMAVNLNGVFHCTAQVIGPMRDAGHGRIINIASTSALKGYAYVSAYCAAKHGVLGLTRALALETAKHGITVNAVCPGYTDTDIIRDSVKNIMQKTGRSEDEALGEFTRSNPQGRLIQPEEVAATVLWLLADNSSSITGQAITVAGGEVM